MQNSDKFFGGTVMVQPYLMTIKDLALFLRTSEKNINNQIYRGEEGEKIPFSFRIGSKRLWSSETVFQWIEEKEKENKPAPHKAKQPEKVSIRRV